MRLIYKIVTEVNKFNYKYFVSARNFEKLNRGIAKKLVSSAKIFAIVLTCIKVKKFLKCLLIFGQFMKLI